MTYKVEEHFNGEGGSLKEQIKRNRVADTFFCELTNTQKYEVNTRYNELNIIKENRMKHGQCVP